MSPFFSGEEIPQRLISAWSAARKLVPCPEGRFERSIPISTTMRPCNKTQGSASGTDHEGSELRGPCPCPGFYLSCKS